ncbi:MAG TPA: AAA family ATPase [Enhygromyxa sp.]|nr:AAA family ATPase [Enhygromyxa sp.]
MSALDQIVRKARRSSHGDHLCRIALTGGPGGGKTTAADMLRREIGERIVVVPESATMLFSGGFPRCNEPQARKAVQQAIFHVQRNLEDLQSARFPHRVLLCDRGTIDGAAYWPSSDPNDFFTELGTTLELELARYDAVLFFETAAVGDLSIETGNPVRIESNAEAVALDTRLRSLWSQHPNFVLIHHSNSFMAKLFEGLHVLGELIRRFSDGEPEQPTADHDEDK